jgi:signal-transduction protein with cAMP-binding, CBS, and nucleotidyltransferase domain
VVLLSDQNGEEQREDLLPLKVRDVMVREVITVDENSSVKEAVEIMNEFQIGSLIVLERGKAKGIVTERDFLRRVIAEAKDVMNTRVKEIMTTPRARTEYGILSTEHWEVGYYNRIDDRYCPCLKRDFRGKRSKK